jgi:DNA-binding NarL/FixJ family response regulator
VNGYLLKGDDLSMSLPGAIETVSRGSIYFSETISQRLFYDDAKRHENVSLTDRQIEVLNAIYSSPDALYSRLAADLGITQPTFKRHLTKSFIALGVTNKTSAMIRCRELGLIRSD